MASIGTSVVEPLPPVTVTQTKGYDGFASVRKFLKHGAITLGSVAAYAVFQWLSNSDNVKTLLGDSPLALLAVPLLAGLAGAGLNWLKHRHDPPALVTVEPLPEGPK